MDSITDFHGDPFGYFMRRQQESGQISASECAATFGRLIVNSWLDGELTERLAYRWGTQAGHYARLAVAERENFTVGLGVIRGAFPEMAGVR